MRAHKKNQHDLKSFRLVHHHVHHHHHEELQHGLLPWPVRLKSPTRSSPASTTSTPFTVVIRLSLLSSRAGRQSKIAAPTQVLHEASRSVRRRHRACCLGLPPKHSFTCWRKHCLGANRTTCLPQRPQQQWCSMKLSFIKLSVPPPQLRFERVACWCHRLQPHLEED